MGFAATLALQRAAGAGGPPERDEPAGRCRPGLRVPNLAEIHLQIVKQHAGHVQQGGGGTVSNSNLQPPRARRRFATLQKHAAAAGHHSA